MGFSCKSQFTAQATLFNAGMDNTNFKYKVKGIMNDAVMGIYNNIHNNGRSVAIAKRMQHLKD